MRIAILGATSQIAKDLIISFAQYDKLKVHLSLFGRRPEEIEAWMSGCGYAIHHSVYSYAEFHNLEFDAIINFVGVGNPAQAAKMGASILDVTIEYDAMALRYLRQHRKCKYIFLSSGAAYGGKFNQPADLGTPASFDLNNPSPQEWYGIAKAYTEALHRAHPELNIIDLRVFSYFSRRQDLNARFLISDMMRAILDDVELVTSPDFIVRDYLHPEDFYNLIVIALQSPPMNLSLDCYTRAPIEKTELLNQMRETFGLKYRLSDPSSGVNATGIKPYYYSLSKKAAELGYEPTRTSLKCVVEEVEAILLEKRAAK